jgi:hypothetical protein
MTTAQENTIARLSATHGAIAVKEGYDDGAVRATAPNGHHWRVLDDDFGTPKDAGQDFSFVGQFITEVIV